MPSTRPDRWRRLGMSGVGVLLQPTSLQTSVTHRSATYTFDRPVLVGYYADSQPFVVSDRLFNITAISPAAASVASGSFVQGGVSFSGQSYVKNGAMVNPWFSASGAKQGFDGLLGVYADNTGQSAAVHDYDNTLNVDPAISGAIAVAVGDEKSIVKSVRASGLTTPGPWRHFDDWCVLHVVRVVPPFGAFAPAAFAISKASAFTTRMRNKAALGAGFDLTGTGMPSLQYCLDNDYFRAFQPYWYPGGGADARRRYMVNPADTNNVGYSRDYGQLWGDFLAAILAAGSSVRDDALNAALTFGLSLIAAHDRGFDQAAGAGQWDGHKQFAQLAGHVFASVAGLTAKALAVKGNATNQQFWVPPGFVGGPTYFPGNHSVNFGTFHSVHVGLPYWGTVVATRPPALPLTYSSDFDNDYELTSLPGYFVELLNSAAFKNGPAGQDGSQVLAGTGPYFGGTGEGGASLAYLDRARANAQQDIWGLTPASTRALAYYDLIRNSMAVPRWTGPPDAGTIDNASPNSTLVLNSGASTNWQVGENVTIGGSVVGKVVSWTTSSPTRTLTISNPVGFTLTGTITGATSGATGVISTYTPSKTAKYLVSAANGFQWNLTNLGAATLPVTDWQIQYSLDGRSWIDVTTSGVSGTQTGLTPSVLHRIRWRRSSTVGGVKTWGHWTVNYPRVQGASERLTVIPTGTPSGTPVNTVAASLVVPLYPAATAPFYVAAPSTMDISVNTTLYAAVGYWTGNITGAFTYQWKRNGVSIPGATADSYALDPADLGTTITCVVTNGGVSATTAGVTIPSLPALPSNVIIDTTFDAAFKLFYSQVWDSFRTTSTSGNVRLDFPTSGGGVVSGTFTAGETVTGSISGATAVVSTWTSGTGRLLLTTNYQNPGFVSGETVTGGTSGAAGTLAAVVGGLKLLPSYTRVSDDGETVITSSVLRLDKTASFPNLQGNAAARKALTVGTVYDVTLKVAIGADVVPSADTIVKFGSASGGNQLCTVTIPPNSAYSSSQGSTGVSNLTVTPNPGVTAPKELTITFTFTAPTTAIYVSDNINTNTGNTGGGNPTLSQLTVVEH